MNLSRVWKQTLLLDLGLLTDDLDMLTAMETVEELPLKELPPGGISLQHIQLGWALLTWQFQKDGHTA